MFTNVFFFKLATGSFIIAVLLANIFKLLEPENSTIEKIISVIMYVFWLIFIVAAIIGMIGVILTI